MLELSNDIKHHSDFDNLPQFWYCNNTGFGGKFEKIPHFSETQSWNKGALKPYHDVINNKNFRWYLSSSSLQKLQNLAQVCVEDQRCTLSSFTVFEKNRATDFIILSSSNHILFSAHWALHFGDICKVVTWITLKVMPSSGLTKKNVWHWAGPVCTFLPQKKKSSIGRLIFCEEEEYWESKRALMMQQWNIPPLQPIKKNLKG